MTTEPKSHSTEYNPEQAKMSLAVNIGSIVMIVALMVFIVGRIDQASKKKELFDDTVPTALNEHMAKEDKFLATLAQADSTKGIYHIPIEDAMAALVAHPDNIVKVPKDLVIEPAPDPETDPAGYGRYVFNRQGNARCIVCHNIAPNGPKKMGPDLYGRFGTDVKLANGETVKYDEEYIRNSIVDPTSQISDGYPPVMPGNIVELNSLSEKDIDTLVEFLKSN